MIPRFALIPSMKIQDILFATIGGKMENLAILNLFFSIGQYNDYTLDLHEMIKQAIEVMDDQNINQYASGQNAYCEIINFILDDEKWSNSVLEAQLFEQVVVYGDVMVMLCNRASAATFF